YPDAQLAGCCAGLDALTDGKLVGHRIELHGRAMNHPEHTAADLAAVWVEANPVNSGDLVVIDRSEGREHRRDEHGAAGVLVPPRTARMKPQDLPGEGVVEVEAP